MLPIVPIECGDTCLHSHK